MTNLAQSPLKSKAQGRKAQRNPNSESLIRLPNWQQRFPMTEPGLTETFELRDLIDLQREAA